MKTPNDVYKQALQQVGFEMARDFYIDAIKALSQEEFEKQIRKKRTLPQNNSLHKGFTQVADTLNGYGLTMQVFCRLGVNWDKESVKKSLFSPIMKSMTGKDSTAKLTTTEMKDVWKKFAHAIADRVQDLTGDRPQVDWPTSDPGYE